MIFERNVQVQAEAVLSWLREFYIQLGIATCAPGGSLPFQHNVGLYFVQLQFASHHFCQRLGHPSSPHSIRLCASNIRAYMPPYTPTLLNIFPRYSYLYILLLFQIVNFWENNVYIFITDCRSIIIVLQLCTVIEYIRPVEVIHIKEHNEISQVVCYIYSIRKVNKNYTQSNATTSILWANQLWL